VRIGGIGPRSPPAAPLEAEFSPQESVTQAWRTNEHSCWGTSVPGVRPGVPVASQSHRVCTKPLLAIDSSAVISGTLEARAAAITILSNGSCTDDNIANSLT